MKDLQIFKSQEFGEIQIIEEKGKFEFEATGSARMLGYVNPHKAIIDHCKKDGVTKREVGVQTGYKKDGTPAIQMVEKNFIDEGNLYRLITHSKLPSAEKFESWVFDEVLPSVRKTGGYIAGEENMTEDELVLKAMDVLNRKVKMLKQKNMQLEGELEEQRPKVLFANSVTASKTSILIGELAKLIKQNGHDIGQNRLFEWLRINNYLINRKGTDYNMPTQKAMNQGLFEIKETTITHADGHISVNKTPKVTGKGQVYFINKFLNKNATTTQNSKEEI